MPAPNPNDRPSDADNGAGGNPGGGGGAIETTATTTSIWTPLLQRQRRRPSAAAAAAAATRTRKLLKKRASLSESERFFLRALLVDDPPVPPNPAAAADERQQRDASVDGDDSRSERSLDGDMLASIPAELVVEVPVEEDGDEEEEDGDGGGADVDVDAHADPSGAPAAGNDSRENNDNGEGGDEEAEAEEAARPPLHPPTHRRDTSLHVGLWRAHEDGVTPARLRRYSSAASPGGSMRGLLVGGGSSRSIGSPAGLIVGGGGMRSPSHRSSLRSSPRSSIRSATSPRPSTAAAAAAGELGDGDDYSIASDESVGRERANDRDGDDDRSDASSWGVDEGGFDHYDAWQLLRDEYAPDFGYSYADTNTNIAAAGGGETNNDEDDRLPHQAAHADPFFGEGDDVGCFRILGTSADDVDSQPHVLSPPLMESLLNFVPEHLSCENLWLKYSLVRDGASIMTLRELCRDSRYTILALETTDGDVLGSFTSSPWRKDFRYFGTGEAFLWKMRHSRQEPCHSIFEQAQLESEIDVFPFSGLNYYVQLCTNEKLAIGGGRLVPGTARAKEEEKKDEDRLASSYPTELAPIRSGDEMDDADAEMGMTMDVGGGFRYTPYGGVGDNGAEVEEEGGNDDDSNANAFGFGLAINRDLLYGTSSPCATFRNPSLSTHSSGEDAFEIVNLEVWTFTPCRTVESAMDLEERKSVRSDSVASSLNEFGGAASSMSRSAGGVSAYLREDYMGGIRPGGGGGGMGMSSVRSSPLDLH